MKRVGVLAAACALVALAAAPAFAHGERDQGDLRFTVGWANEPALVGQPNAVQLELVHDGAPVKGAEDTLKVTVTIGGESTDPLELETVFDSPGEYRASLIPTVVGGYTFRFTGTVDGEKVDQRFTSPKDGFDEVEGTSDIAFPKKAPTTTELAGRFDTTDRLVAEAKSAAIQARLIAFFGLFVALAGVAFGLFARRRA